MKKLIIILTLLFSFPSFSRVAKKVLIKTEFQNKNWFPLTKKEMRLAAVDTALEELTRSNLIEIVKKNNQGEISLRVVLVEKAATGKITITFTAKGTSSIVTTSSASLNNLKKEGIYKALEKMGKDAGKKMKAQLIKVIPPDEVDKKLEKLYGKEWDNFETEKLFNQAQKLKRENRFAESRRLFVYVSKRKDKGSQQWKRLADDELIFRLPLFEANYMVTEASSKRKQIPIDKVRKIYNQMLKDNRSDELRITQIQEALDRLSFAKSMLSTAHQHALRGYIKNIQMSVMMHFMERGKAPTSQELDKQFAHMFRGVEISNYKVGKKGRTYSFTIRSTKTGATADVKADVEQRSMPEVNFR